MSTAKMIRIAAVVVAAFLVCIPLFLYGELWLTMLGSLLALVVVGLWAVVLDDPKPAAPAPPHPAGYMKLPPPPAGGPEPETGALPVVDELMAGKRSPVRDRAAAAAVAAVAAGIKIDYVEPTGHLGWSGSTAHTAGTYVHTADTYVRYWSLVAYIAGKKYADSNVDLQGDRSVLAPATSLWLEDNSGSPLAPKGWVEAAVEDADDIIDEHGELINDVVGLLAKTSSVPGEKLQQLWKIHQVEQGLSRAVSEDSDA